MFTKQEAVKYYESKKWESLTDEERAMLQIKETYLCMSFQVFCNSVSAVLGRTVGGNELSMEKVNIYQELIDKLNEKKEI